MTVYFPGFVFLGTTSKFWKRKMKSSSFVASRWVVFCTLNLLLVCFWRSCWGVANGSLKNVGLGKILTGSRNLGSIFDKSRSLVFGWFVSTFFESRNFLPKSLGLGFLARVSASRRVSDFTIRHLFVAVASSLLTLPATVPLHTLGAVFEWVSAQRSEKFLPLALFHLGKIAKLE